MTLIAVMVFHDKSLVLILVKKNATFCLSLHYNHDNSYQFVNGKEIYHFKAENENANFPNQFFIQNISNGFGSIDSRDIPSK